MRRRPKGRRRSVPGHSLLPDHAQHEIGTIGRIEHAAKMLGQLRTASGKKAARNRHLRIGENRPDVALLDDPARIDHRHAVGDRTHDIHFVGDQDDRQAELAVDIAQQRQNRTGRFQVERRRGLVGQKEGRATAPSNTGTWLVPPSDNRVQVVERRWQRTCNLADQRWMLRTVDQAYENLLKLAEWGYPFPDDEDGRLYIADLRGPDCMAFMRRRVLKASVTVLDHNPALEFYFDGEAVTRAAGVDRQRDRDW